MKNPILPGFNPDPAICCKGSDFYLATSSFQWWPGAPIYHSQDLRHWELIGHALADSKHIDLRRIGDSAGIWAPSLTYADGLFWLVFTIASGSRQHWPECDNCLITAANPLGPWSDPVYLNSTGNDPSLFHDDDGRKWLLNTDFVRAPGYKAFRGTLLQEYSPEENRLIGPRRNIFAGTELGTPEGSKLYKHRGWYHLNTAEGGTAYGHVMTMARAQSIWGPYEVHPDNPVLTAKNEPDNPIQRAGHGDLVTLAEDRVAVVYLASRPIERRSLLGRETFLAAATWCEDDWLRLDSPSPKISVPEFDLPEAVVPGIPNRDDFNEERIGLHWNSLRQPINDRLDFSTRPGWLILKPTPSPPDSLQRPSILVRRILHHRFSASTILDFQAVDMQQWAGLICYYDSRHWYYLHRQFDEHQGACVALYAKRSEQGHYEDLGHIPVADTGIILLSVDCTGRKFHFRFSMGDDGPWQSVGEPQDALVLSDEYVESEDPVRNFGFTGACIGLAAYDITGQGPMPAFDWFKYCGRDEWP